MVTTTTSSIENLKLLTVIKRTDEQPRDNPSAHLCWVMRDFLNDWCVVARVAQLLSGGIGSFRSWCKHSSPRYFPNLFGLVSSSLFMPSAVSTVSSASHIECNILDVICGETLGHMRYNYRPAAPFALE